MTIPKAVEERENFKAYIRERLSSALRPFIGTPHSQGSALLEAVHKFSGEILKTLEAKGVAPGQAFADLVQVAPVEGKPGEFRITMPVDRDTLGRIVESLYAEGKSHHAVTAWLQDHVQGFRGVLSEVHYRSGTESRWMPTPEHLAVTLESSPARWDR